MKKLLALLLVASIGLAVTGCGKSEDSSSAAPTTGTGIKDKTPKADEE